MPSMVAEDGRGGLEGLCEAASAIARIRMGPGCTGIERLKARFPGRAFAPHRHDTYAIGITLAAAGTDAGFAYRITYLDPALVQEALGGRPLPFVAEPVTTLSDTQRTSLAPAWTLGGTLDEANQPTWWWRSPICSRRLRAAPPGPARSTCQRCGKSGADLLPIR